MAKLNPLRDVILFEFIDETSGMKRGFTDITKSGIIIPQADTMQKVARWGKVLARGPDSGVEVNQYVLVEGLQWTTRTEVDGQVLWKTEDSRILAVTDNIEDCTRQ